MPREARVREVPTEGGLTMRPIDGDALFAVVRGHHDLYKGATNPADKARRDECLQVMCDINDTPTIDAIPMWWITEKFLDVLNKDKELSKAVWLVRKAWQEEQEAR